MLNLAPERFEKLLACKRAAIEYLALHAPEELDEAERLLCIEMANCAESLRRGAASPCDGSARPSPSAEDGSLA